MFLTETWENALTAMFLVFFGLSMHLPRDKWFRNFCMDSVREKKNEYVFRKSTKQKKETEPHCMIKIAIANTNTKRRKYTNLGEISFLQHPHQHPYQQRLWPRTRWDAALASSKTVSQPAKSYSLGWGWIGPTLHEFSAVVNQNIGSWNGRVNLELSL